MSESNLQSFENHGRIDPPFHYVLLPVLLVNLIVAIVHLWHHPEFFSVWLLILSIAVLIPVAKTRMYALKVQDRVIRLEERLRLEELAPPEWHPQILRLSEDQLIGLRFASDGEVVALAQLAVAQNLSRQEIKERIKTWRPDNWRV